MSTFRPSQPGIHSLFPLPWQPVTGTTRQHRSGGHHTLLPCSDRPDHFPPALPCVHDDTTQRPNDPNDPNDQLHEPINQPLSLSREGSLLPFASTPAIGRKVSRGSNISSCSSTSSSTSITSCTSHIIDIHLGLTPYRIRPPSSTRTLLINDNNLIFRRIPRIPRSLLRPSIKGSLYTE